MSPEKRSVIAISAVATLGAVEGVQSYGVSLFTPQLAAAFKVGALSLVSARLLGLLVGAGLPLVVPAVTATRRLRVRVWTSRIAALGATAALALTGRASSTGALIGLLCLGAAVSAPGQAMHRVMVIDDAMVGSRVSALSALSIATFGAQLVLTIAVASGAVTSWTRALEALGTFGLIAVVVGSTLLRIKQPQLPPKGVTEDSDELPWPEIARAWRSIPTLVGLGLALLAVGAVTVPFESVFALWLHGRWRLDLAGACTVFMVVALVSAIAVLLNARRADRLLVATPERLAAESVVAMAGGAVLLGVGVYLPDRAAMVAFVSLGTALIAAVVPMLGALAFSVVPPSQRAALSSALAGVLPAGATIGVVYATSFGNRHGERTALVALSALALIGALVWRACATSLETDQERVASGAANRQARLAALASGNRPPLLECHNLAFSYGSLQVLFDVDFTIDEGEVVALLGTNGAGKSTLLKVISGIGAPHRGSVRLAGRDITYLDAEARVRSGITAIPGGRAVFGSMTVMENLQSFGYTLGRDRKTIAEAIDRCFAAFPALAERRTSLAATLSGGEQQMLGLSKALIVRPRLLLIDELSLGLAPVVVGPLLDMVRRINAEGTAIVIVEQSVNIALSLVDHAYFMEKGAVRFDGQAKDLLERGDLLRAVFLEGAAKGALT